MDRVGVVGQEVDGQVDAHIGSVDRDRGIPHIDPGSGLTGGLLNDVDVALAFDDRLVEGEHKIGRHVDISRTNSRRGNPADREGEHLSLFESLDTGKGRGGPRPLC